jgi:hypothetical protein
MKSNNTLMDNILTFGYFMTLGITPLCMTFTTARSVEKNYDIP